MKSLEQLDRWIGAKFRGWATRVSGAPRNAELLEIRRDILENVRDHIEPLGQGRAAFPYRTVVVEVRGPSEEDRARVEAAFGGPDGLEADVRELLVEARCPVPAGLSVTVRAVEGEGGFRVDYLSKGAEPARERAPRPVARLVVTHGEAEPSSLEISRDRVNLGRMAEVSTEEQGLRRRNDIAFGDAETSVSREHAYIAYHADTQEFRIYDNNSARGTSVFREGRRLEVTRGARGLRLVNGDEIHLGRVQLRFETG